MSDKARASIKTADVQLTIQAVLDINGLDEIVTVHVQNVELAMPQGADKSLRARVTALADEVAITILGQSILNARNKAKELTDQIIGKSGVIKGK